jgi:hypothetical protein
LAISYVNLPGDFTDIPSAMVYPAFIFCKEPLASDSFIAGKALDSTPIILTLGFLDFMAIAIPAASPPPPIGKYTWSSSGKSSNSSRPIVPWPDIT